MASSGPSSDRPTTPSGSSDRHPLSHTGSGTSLVQIGHYVLGETLGIGTFGKVKGIIKINSFISLMTTNHFKFEIY